MHKPAAGSAGIPEAQEQGLRRGKYGQEKDSVSIKTGCSALETTQTDKKQNKQTKKTELQNLSDIVSFWRTNWAQTPFKAQWLAPS